MLESARTLLISCPTPLAVVVVFVFGCFALESPPSYIPLVLLLAITRVFSSVIITSKRAIVKLTFVVVSLAAATTLGNISAVPEVQYSTAVLALFILALLASSLATSAIFADTYLQWNIDCERLPLFFPAMWSTVLLIASTTSPLGYLAIWSPVRGLSAYNWMRYVLGPVGIDWTVGAWAVVVAELLAPWFTKPAEQDDLLISTSGTSATDETEKSQKTPRLLCMITFLCLGTIPYYFQDTLPIPVNSATTAPLSVACALPYITNITRSPNFGELLQETATLASLAKVVLWPEGAIRFDSVQAKREATKKVAKIAGGSVIGVSFEEYTNDVTRGNKGRNGLMLVDRDGMVFEYFKRHLVPFVESYAMVAYSSPPELYDYQLVTKRNSRGKAIESLTVPITGSICLDFAHPMPFNRLPRRPSLILGAARTWYPSLGVTMWEHAKARAEEVGSAVLWCDGGEQGISGVGGRGMGGGEIVQVGPGSWVRTIGLEIEANHERTAYAFIGPWFSIAFIWLVVFAGRISEKVVQRIREGGSIGSTLQGYGLIRRVLDTYRAWRRGREINEADETTHLL
ncbi:uncharacterized protein FOMMEDRAFT_133077 [Fomitiporia mediterranea MF3/22]|uniref:uncharacterized protein n=1 Tax=Fomitiporia mediterranea (strain MF3/22) TaxID=694068 RepID=UPI0004408FC0|nr:uncharacterized protein FOMMEDRAFT_133077 [Fomitiporia mediterranea MF3/22]EJD03681.1 hypothetical protein FOMMEDRAFT_133077 [Fomitiporia mediterranea MF3/22]